MTTEEKLRLALEALGDIASLHVGPTKGGNFGRWHEKHRHPIDHAERAEVAVRRREEQIVGRAQIALLAIDPDIERLPEPEE